MVLFREVINHLDLLWTDPTYVAVGMSAMSEYRGERRDGTSGAQGPMAVPVLGAGAPGAARLDVLLDVELVVGLVRLELLLVELVELGFDEVAVVVVLVTVVVVGDVELEEVVLDRLLDAPPKKVVGAPLPVIACPASRSVRV